MRINAPLCSGTFSDDISGSGVDVNSVKIVLGGQDVTAQANVSAGGFSFTAAGLSEGFHNFRHPEVCLELSGGVEIK